MTAHSPSPALWSANDAVPTAARASDAALLVRVRQQHPAALQELYIRYFPAAYALAVRMVGDPAQAEACAAAVFLHLWEQPPPLDPLGGDLSDWVLTAAHQQARTQQRGASPLRPPAGGSAPAPRASAADPVGVGVDSGPAGSGRAAALQHLAARQAVARAAVAALPPAERAVLELAYFAGLTQGEIAVTLAEALDTVRIRLRAGLRHLHTALAAAAVGTVPTGPEGGAGAAPSSAPQHPPSAAPAPDPPPLTQLAAVLASMTAATQQAAALRERATLLRQRSATTHQHAAVARQRADATLQQLAVLQELYTYLGAVLTTSTQRCEATFAQTEAYFAAHPDNIDVSQVLAVLTLLNAHCDCEAYRLLPAVLR